MTSSLVGSEMCIRDRSDSQNVLSADLSGPHPKAVGTVYTYLFVAVFHTVSYTHLTLPTICSV
eukprot:2473949-Prorocentrum_lima.AAC.1